MENWTELIAWKDFHHIYCIEPKTLIFCLYAVLLFVYGYSLVRDDIVIDHMHCSLVIDHMHWIGHY